MNSDNQKRTIFLTGATGLVGSYLLKLLLQHGHKVYCLARSKDNKIAKNRVVDILNFWDRRVYPKYSHNLKVVEGDITKANLGLTKTDRALLKRDVEEIFHCAAMTNYNQTEKELKKVNILGTKKIFDLAVQLQENDRCGKVNFISTAYVCGDHKGIFSERDLDVGQNFSSIYYKSKFEAEKITSIYRKKGVWIDIFRPAIVIGESQTGKTFALQQNLYQIIHIWKSSIFDFFPGREFHANIVPVDELVKSILIIAFNSRIRNCNYHIFSKQRVPLSRILTHFRNFCGFKKPKAVSCQQLSRLKYTPAQKEIIKSILLNFNGQVKLRSQSTNNVLKGFGFAFSKINKKTLDNMFEYLRKIHFL